MKAQELPVDFFETLPDNQLLEKSGPNVRHTNRKRILESEKWPPAKSQKTVQLACNCDPYIKTQVESIDLKLGRIPNPYEIVSVAPVRGFGLGSSLNWLKTRGPPGKPISEMSPKLIIISQGERDNHFNSHNADRLSPGKPRAKGSLSSYQIKDLEQIADGLVGIWERIKADSPVYRSVEKSIT